MVWLPWVCLRGCKHKAKNVKSPSTKSKMLPEVFGTSLGEQVEKHNQYLKPMDFVAYKNIWHEYMNEIVK